MTRTLEEMLWDMFNVVLPESTMLETDFDNDHSKNGSQSPAAQEAARLGLEYLSFGRWGKEGKVTHTSKGGKLTPVDAKAFPRPSIHPAVPGEVKKYTGSPEAITQTIQKLEQNIAFENDRLKQYPNSSARTPIITQIRKMEQIVDILKHKLAQPAL
jgi:hypothetical protein